MGLRTDPCGLPMFVMVVADILFPIQSISSQKSLSVCVVEVSNENEFTLSRRLSEELMVVLVVIL